MKKTLAMLLAALMLIGLMAGCASEPAAPTTPADTTTEQPADTTPEAPADEPTEAPADEPETPAEAPADEPAEVPAASVYPICEQGEITLEWMEKAMDDQMVMFEDDNSQNVMFRELTKITGIEFDFNYISVSAFNEQFNLMLVAEDYPDICNVISPDQCGASGDAAYQDEVIVRLNEYEHLLPNYMSYINANEVNQRNAYTDEGNLLTFYQIYNRLQPMFLGYVIRQDWLDELGLAMPTTIDEWHDVLTVFKNEKTNGAEPMELPDNAMPLGNFFQAAYGISTGAMGAGNYFVQKDGVVSSSLVDNGLRAYLETLSQWYAEGLINKDFVSGESSDPRIAADQVGAMQTLYFLAGNHFANVGTAPEGAFYAMAPVPTLEKGVANKIGGHGKDASVMVANGAVVFTSCENIEAAMQLMDYFYSEDGIILSNYGVEGETYDITEDGKRLIRDEFSERQVYMMHSGSKIFVLDVEEDASPCGDYALEYYNLWNDFGEWNLDGNITFNSDEAEERARIMADVTTYFGEFSAKVITGMTELNDDTWNEYVDYMNQLGIETAVEITQTAYNRYLAR